MSINLIVAPYCQDCGDFDPVVKTDTLNIDDNDPKFPNTVTVIRNTEVRCKYCKRCENIKRYLDKENKKNVNYRN